MQQDLRILHVTECDSGGVVRAADLAARTTPGHRHYFLGPQRACAAVPSMTAAYPHTGKRGDAVARLRRLTAELGIDVVHAHSSWAGVWARSCRLDVPVVYQPHCYKFADPAVPGWRRQAYRVAERVLAGRSSAVIALTAWEHEASRRLGARHVFTVPNEPTLPPAPVGTAQQRDRRVVMVGRVSPQKDPRFFAEVARTTRAGDATIEFMWIGGGDAGLVSTLEDAGVVVTGWLESETLLREAMTAASLYVHTARYEGFPLSVLDAAVTATPVLVRDIPAFEGAGLPAFSTPLQASDLVRRTLDSPGELEAARRAVVGLPHRLLSSPSARRLEDVYRAVLERPAS